MEKMPFTWYNMIIETILLVNIYLKNENRKMLAHQRCFFAMNLFTDNIMIILLKKNCCAIEYLFMSDYSCRGLICFGTLIHFVCLANIHSRDLEKQENLKEEYLFSFW